MRAFVLACSLLAVAPSAASAATRTFPVPMFDKVRSAVPFDVHVHVGPRPIVHAVGKDDVLARLHVGVRNGELEIDSEDGHWFRNFTWRKEDHIVIDVTLPNLTGVALTGPGNMTVDAVRAPGFTGALSGPGTIAIAAIDTGRADLALSGPGTFSLTGRAGSAHVVGSGPGDLKARGLSAGEVAVDLSGPGNVAITALRTATVRLSGPGDVHIFGNPRCQVTKTGPGTVRCGG